MVERLHILVTDEGDHGWSVESPQFPGFTMGRQTLAELKRDLIPALRFANAPESDLVLHMVQRRLSPEGEEFLVRIAEDAHRADRLEAYRRLLGIMETDQRVDMLTTARIPTGEASFITVVPSDTLGWLGEQLYDEDDVFTIVVAVADEGLFSTQMSSDPSRSQQGWKGYEEMGWTVETTVSEVLRTLAGKAQKERTLIAR